MSTLPISVLIAIKNEERNLSKCLASLKPAEKIFVIDSGSQDGSVEIAEKSGAEIVQFRYQGGYPKKRQWGLENLKIETPWVLLLDADEVVPEKLWLEIEEGISTSQGQDAFFITKGFHFLGKKFKYGGFSHSAVILFKLNKARFEHILDEPPSAPDMEIHERLNIRGTVDSLRTPLVHEDFKGLEAYISRHNLYSTWEAQVRYQYITTGKWGEASIEAKLLGNSQERRRFLKKIAVRMPFEPFLWFCYHYFFRLGFLEGRAGLIACQIRAAYIAQVRAKLYELKLKEQTII